MPKPLEETDVRAPKSPKVVPSANKLVSSLSWLHPVVLKSRPTLTKSIASSCVVLYLIQLIRL